LIRKYNKNNDTSNETKVNNTECAVKLEVLEFLSKKLASSIYR